LLHPPNLESDGLTRTIREFVDGFCRRTGLRAAVRISGGVDYLPFELQRSMLRIVQEAMANIQHHATASRVSLILRQRGGRLVLRVRDNGRGAPESASANGPHRLGVGILGMRARLRQFGGELSIETNSRGTTLLAVVPLTVEAMAGGQTSSPPPHGLNHSESLDG